MTMVVAVSSKCIYMMMVVTVATNIAKMMVVTVSSKYKYDDGSSS